MNTRPTDNPQSTYSQGSIQDFSFGAEVLSGQRPQASCRGGGEGGGNVIVIFYFKIILHVPCHLVSSDREY